ncbi:hypothetical protein BDF21DRAFT_376012 [Thamnidium elegans]|uniref:Uncharacterized protein n=1 Tax=Thamnidium elegans TaxID=101142 RepID=A0A8H7SFF9_9FUNG|nr:hypothetical protein INT48_005380 [Thamnidium elegans]KAI8094707.1 hypothetical protein BDF21DRAFT_376012 [Thamnidium elegans]
MYNPFDYFDTTKKSAWNLRDAFSAYQKSVPDLSITQQLTRFHEKLKKENDNITDSWLSNWNSFCKKTESYQPASADTSSSIFNINMESSTNNSCSFGTVSNHYHNKYKKRGPENDDLENAPTKKHNSEITSDTVEVNEQLTHLEADQLADLETDQLADLETNKAVIINSQDDIWACWKLHLNDNSLHKYSLERLGIIQIGNKLSCPEYYSIELYNLLIYKPAPLINPISNNSEIFDRIFDLSSNKELMSRQLHQITYEEKQDPQVFMVAAVIEIFIKTIFADVCVTDQESNYSHYVIWPLLDAIVTTVNNLNFHCGEYRLKSVDKELSRRSICSQHYKSDGCISTVIDNTRIELAILEVSGPYKLDEQSRFTKDHIKAGYGLIAMINEIAYLYKYASFDIFTKVRLFFIHAKKNKLRLWSFEMPAPGLYILNLLNSVIIPDNCASCELPMESLCVELWNLRAMLQQTLITIDNLRESHIVNQRIYSRAHRQSPDLVPTLLTDALRINPQVKLDKDYLPADDELAINSSLF